MQGRQYCFLSNIDNLGATVDTRILDLVLKPGQDAPEFVMEVTDKTKADVKVSTQRHRGARGPGPGARVSVPRERATRSAITPSRANRQLRTRPALAYSAKKKYPISKSFLEFICISVC